MRFIKFKHRFCPSIRGVFQNKNSYYRPLTSNSGSIATIRIAKETTKLDYKMMLSITKIELISYSKLIPFFNLNGQIIKELKQSKCLKFKMTGNWNLKIWHPAPQSLRL